MTHKLSTRQEGNSKIKIEAICSIKVKSGSKNKMMFHSHLDTDLVGLKILLVILMGRLMQTLETITTQK